WSAGGPLVRVLFHPDAGAAKGDAFGFEAEALFESVFAGQGDFAAGADDAMPGKTAGGSQGPDYLTRATGETGGAGDVAIGGDFAFGDAANGVADDFEHGGYWARYQASVRRRPSSSEYSGRWPRSRTAAVVSACESRTSPARGGA